ncbi:serine/threonine kinase family protein [Plesiocystis pacifica SIR-1]|uniref:Serine/threonine kinase family protein n=1 Tax=Plesiocystis pacifica SIR-1 TaxID=391625 RepID=A6G8W5_9BACT|nr:serine/threonine-protein kinase [Plesiocystis pacifica]EDM77651.1 serine/threonine kinase family protein [Plesiocystis pacifica SIR-1]
MELETKFESDTVVDALVGVREDGEALEVDALAAHRRLRAQLFPHLRELPPAVTIGRFTIVRKLGEGGMGVVYACYDERLDRKVAVKLLRSGKGGERSVARLRREAMALARLSHPNVVQIYEVGDLEDGLFLAMEFVVGATFGDWLRGEARDWREVLRALIQAGRGLAAAHEAGLVHRDFKPDNVIVGEDGRVRVLDFGLARGGLTREARALHTEAASAGGGARVSLDPSEAEGPTLDASEADERAALERTESVPGNLLARSLTQHGTLLGTPAYMAPEQIETQPCTAASDQFAFCVVAHEALYGARPFVATNLLALKRSIDAGEIGPVSAGSPVPRRVHQALARGLAAAPEQRWSSLAELLDALEASVENPRRRGGVMLGALAIAALAGGLALAGGSATPEPCAVDASALAGTWDAQRRADLQRSFEASGLGFAGAGFEVVAGALDDWSTGWVDERRAACLATRVEGTQSEDLLDRRVACLDRKRSEAEAVVEVLRGADEDPSRVSRAVELLDGLPSLEACADPDLLDEPFALPKSPERALAILTGFEDVARAESLSILGDVAGAAALREELRQRSATAEHPPLRLEVEALAAKEAFWRDDYGTGVTILLALVREAEGLRLDRFVASGRVILARQAAGTWSQPAREADLVAEAEAALARVGGGEPRQKVRLIQARVRLLEQAGEHEEALEAHEQVITEAGELPPHAAARALLEHARLLAALGRFPESEGALDRAGEYVASLGEGSPAAANLAFDRAMLALERGDFEGAGEQLERAEAIRRDAFGDASRPVAEVLFARSKLAMGGGELERALEWVEAAASIYAARPELGPGLLEDVEEARGVFRFFAGDFEGSIAAYEHSLKLRTSRLGLEHPSVAQLHANIGEARAALGDHEGALEAYGRALPILVHAEAMFGDALALALKGRGQSRLALGETVEAISDLERALGVVSAAEPHERADIQASLAQALRDAGRERDRAQGLAAQAAAGFRSLDMVERAEQLERTF